MKRKLFIKVLAIILAVLLTLTFVVFFAGCEKQITQGEVIDKNFYPAHTVYRLIPIITSNGKTSTTYFIPYVYRYPDTYKITISGLDKNGKAKTATYRFTKGVFEAVPLGAEFVYKSDMQPDEPEYQREPGSQ